MSVIDNVYKVFSYFNRSMNDFCKSKGYNEMTVASYQFLRLIYENEGGRMSVKCLSERLQVKTSSITQMTNVLIKKGYVTKEENASDYRSRDVVISQKGRCFMEEDETLYTAFEDKLSKSLTSEEINQLDKLLLKIIGGIENES